MERLEAECTRLSRLLATQAAQLDALERDNAALKHQVAQRDADCAQLGALLAAVHRRELHPDQLADFAALPAAAGSSGQAAKARSAFDNMPTEGVHAAYIPWQAVVPCARLSRCVPARRCDVGGAAIVAPGCGAAVFGAAAVSGDAEVAQVKAVRRRWGGLTRRC